MCMSVCMSTYTYVCMPGCMHEYVYVRLRVLVCVSSCVMAVCYSIANSPVRSELVIGDPDPIWMVLIVDQYTDDSKTDPWDDLEISFGSCGEG